jgi:two-component system response regulator
LRPILLVEDNRDDETLVRRALRWSGVDCEVVVARDGAAALDWLFGLGEHRARDVQEQPLLVLLDISLPVVDGFQVLREIRADPMTCRVPVVVLTASSRQSDVLSGYDAGANGYVVKPTELPKFVDAARQLGHYWAQYNEAAPITAS